MEQSTLLELETKPHWIYKQWNGVLLDAAGIVRGVGYSGNGVGKNRPDYEKVKCVGPIPAAWFRMVWIGDTDTHGPCVVKLIALEPEKMFGRDGFLIHGDSLHAPGTASHGCISVGPMARQSVRESIDAGIDFLRVMRC